MEPCMIYAADTHVHLYPYYDLAQAFTSAFKNLNRLAKAHLSPGGVYGPDSLVKLLFLTEGQHYQFFHQFQEGVLRIDEENKFKIKKIENRILEITDPSGDRLFLIAGRQIVSRDRIEILGLMLEKEIENGLASEDIMDQILREGGIPVLSWAPGKWLFKRGKKIRSLLERYTREQIALGDTTLRPGVLEPPGIMSFAMGKGYSILAGTDSLPFSGEEEWIGKYGTISKDLPQDKDLFSAIRTMLFSGTNTTIGKRGSLPSVLRRLLRHSLIRCI
jgi:hypothetical protein